MRNKTKIALVLLSVSAAALALFAGCSGEMTADEFLKDKNATDQVVTYYANGGKFDGTNSVEVKTIYYTADSYVVGDFENTANISIAKPENTFGGWYYAVTDSDGKLPKDENGNDIVNVSDRPVDFTVKIQQGEHWYVCATWVPNIRVDIQLVTEDKGTMHDRNGKEYKHGEIIAGKTFNSSGFAIVENNDNPVASTDYTFTQFFYDEKCTQRVTGNIKMPEGEKPANPKIYAQYIKGKWTMVRSDRDVQNMFFNAGSGSYYFCNMSEDKVIDCSGRSIRNLNFDVFGARVEGNGFTLKNLSCTVANAMQAGGTYSVFGRFTADAVLRDLTIDGLTVNVTNARQNVSLYLLGSGAENGATIENVAFKNVKLTVATNTDIMNIAKAGEEYVSTNWLFGGEGTDVAFLEKFKGITVERATLLIGSGKIEELDENGKEYTFPNA